MNQQAELVLIFGGYGLLCGIAIGLALSGWVKRRLIARAYGRGYDHGRVDGLSMAARTVTPAKVVRLTTVRGGR